MENVLKVIDDAIVRTIGRHNIPGDEVVDMLLDIRLEIAAPRGEVEPKAEK